MTKAKRIKTLKRPDAVKVKQLAATDVDPIRLASHAARTCYAADVPELGEIIDVENRLFRTGHHSTLEHNYYTFNIDGIPVSSMVFGLHLTAPFYNTDQRSGRFSKMYDNPDMNEIENILYTYYPDLWGSQVERIEDFIQTGLDVYAYSKDRVTDIARDAIKKERPHASAKYIEQNAPKFAQEQLRMFISMIAPTALDWTVDLPTIAAFYRTAWTRPMRDTMDKIVELVKKDQKTKAKRKNNDNTDKNVDDISYMFNPNARGTTDWTPEFPGYKGVKTRPEFELVDFYYDDKAFTENNANDMVDTLQFSPNTMDNSLGYIHSRIHIDAGATMGQDQRHRSIKRSKPKFTGYFYLPPLLDAANLEPAANEFMQKYEALYNDPNLDKSLLGMIAPYGLMVQYDKRADLNALIHEQGKRTCWCAQEAIYHISCDLRRDLAQEIGTNAKLMKYLTPPCLSMGKCPEGPRTCGRDLVAAMRDGYFQKRRV
ncbi:MAG: FAD-dependent thymidylate synthase [Alphaproteobacteria bacterium]|nr:FAD-dependent thymidylate synthase [Alphaproteobacteria bacterium]